MLRKRILPASDACNNLESGQHNICNEEKTGVSSSLLSSWTVLEWLLGFGVLLILSVELHDTLNSFVRVKASAAERCTDDELVKIVEKEHFVSDFAPPVNIVGKWLKLPTSATSTAESSGRSFFENVLSNAKISITLLGCRIVDSYLVRHITRCTTTAYSLSVFFCSENIAMAHYGPRTYTKRLRDLREHLALMQTKCKETNGETKSCTRIVYRMTFGSSRANNLLGHEWTLVRLSSGSFHWLQSFYAHYTLREWLQSGSHLLSYRNLSVKLDELELLENEVGWGSDAENSYRSLFNLSIQSEYIAKQRSIPEDNRNFFSWQFQCEHDPRP